jgi:hypothetical protein
MLTVFFWFGTAMSGVTCLALLLPKTRLAAVWRLNPEAHTGFQAMGAWAVVLMLVVAIACMLSAIGLSRRTLWGQKVAISILVINIAGDVGNAVIRGDLRTLIGIPIGASMIGYLLTRGVRTQLGARNRGD